MTFPQQYDREGGKAVIAFNAFGADLVATLPPPTNPRNIQQPFVVGTLFVVNNTGNTLSLARTATVGAPSNPAVTVPPRFSMPIVGWYTADVWLWGDGSAVEASDSLTIYAREDLAPFNSASILGSGYPSIRNPYLPNGYDQWGFYGHLITENVILGSTDPATATPMNMPFCGYAATSGGATFRQTNPLATRPQTVRLDTLAVANDGRSIVGVDGISGLGRTNALGIPHYNPKIYFQRQLIIEALIIISSNINVNVFCGFAYAGTTDPFLGAAAYASGIGYQPDTGPGPGANPDWKLYNVDNGSQGVFNTNVNIDTTSAWLLKVVLAGSQLYGYINGVGFGPFATQFPSLVDRLVPRLTIITREAAIKTVWVERVHDWVA